MEAMNDMEVMNCLEHARVLLTKLQLEVVNNSFAYGKLWRADSYIGDGQVRLSELMFEVEK